MLYGNLSEPTAHNIRSCALLLAGALSVDDQTTIAYTATKLAQACAEIDPAKGAELLLEIDGVFPRGLADMCAIITRTYWGIDTDEAYALSKFVGAIDELAYTIWPDSQNLDS